MSLIGNKYILQNKIAEGCFGKIYKGTHQNTKKTVAIKMESKESEMTTIKHETILLNYLYRNGCRDIPFVFWYGLHNEYNCLVMTYFERSLKECAPVFFKKSEKVDRLICRMIQILENIHSYGVIHRDIKVENFMLIESDIFLIDFGMATLYIDENKHHISRNENRTMIMGTPKYISVNIHNGIEPSRRDDLMSIGYLYLFLYHGELSWQNQPFYDDSSYLPMHILHPANLQKKIQKENLLETLDNSLPIYSYLKYCSRLNFNENPNYDFLSTLFSNLFGGDGR
jgi:serine/threonine protein kinase